MKKTYASKTTSTHGNFVQINDLELYYEDYGCGSPLLLLHGFGGCTQNWQPFAEKLAEKYRLILVDLPGHGYSTNPSNTFTHKEVASNIFLLLNHLGINHFSAMGMSSGGMILLHMATCQPNRIDCMVLISATTHFPNEARNIMRRASFPTLPVDVKEMYQECAKQGDEQITQLIKQFNSLAENYDDMNFTDQSLKTIKTKTLVIHGDQDIFFPIEIPEQICRSIPNSTLWLIPNGDHVPVYNSIVDFTSTALDFLKQKPSN